MTEPLRVLRRVGGLEAPDRPVAVAVIVLRRVGGLEGYGETEESWLVFSAV